ncbi:MAG: helix-turn-helix domain-containing protein [Chloroflexota bacterium]|nr:helix-turn-helix domain-containing protein [Chloroflexota bacterium]
MTERDDVMAAIRETVEGLHAAGVVNKQTLREFDVLTRARIHDLSPEEIRGLREREHVSQAVFALHLNVNKSLISQWERGEKRPAGPSLKLLSLVRDKGLSAIV